MAIDLMEDKHLGGVLKAVEGFDHPLMTFAKLFICQPVCQIDDDSILSIGKALSHSLDRDAFLEGYF